MSTSKTFSSGDPVDIEMDHSWIDCEELIDHIGVLSKHIGAKRHPRKYKGYGKGVCRHVFDHLRQHEPLKLDAIVNVGHHIRQGGKVETEAKVENVARSRRLAHDRRRRKLEPSGCDGPPNGSVYQMGNPGASSTTTGIPIGACPVSQSPNFESPQNPDICIPGELSDKLLLLTGIVPRQHLVF